VKRGKESEDDVLWLVLWILVVDADDKHDQVDVAATYYI